MTELLETFRRRLPRVRVDLGPSFGGWALRLVAALLPGLLVLAALVRTPQWAAEHYERTGATTGVTAAGVLVGTVLLAAAALVVCALLAPQSWLPLAAVLIAAWLLALAPATAWWGLVLAPLGLLAFRLGALAATVPWTARVEWAAFGHALRADLLIIGATLTIGALGMLVEAVVRGDELPAGLVVGALAVLGLAWRVRRTP